MEQISIRKPLLLAEKITESDSVDNAFQKTNIDEADIEEISEPFELGKSYLMPEKWRQFKNTDGANVPWPSSSSSKKVTSNDDKVVFFENAAKPPPQKRER